MYIMESAPGPKTIINGQEMDYFCGCSYYSLHGHPELIRAAQEAVARYGIGSATSRSGYGNNPVLLRVEELASTFFGSEASLYFVSGYLGNSILLQGLKELYDIIFVDQESHYSVKDGILMADKPFVLFRHLDPQNLEEKIREELKPGQRPLVICDGVFPVSGEISPLPDYLEVLRNYENSFLCVDDAHAIGVLGEQGRGTFEYFGVKEEKAYFSGTLSKAIGGHGGIIPGRKDFIEKLKSNSNIPYASSATPTGAAAATARALEMFLEHPEMREKLRENVNYAREKLRNLGFEVAQSPVPIICLFSKEINLEQLQLYLWSKKIAVLYVPGGSYSSVPETGALRIAIFSNHTREQIDRLVDEINLFIGHREAK